MSSSDICIDMTRGVPGDVCSEGHEDNVVSVHLHTHSEMAWSISSGVRRLESSIGRFAQERLQKKSVSLAIRERLVFTLSLPPGFASFPCLLGRAM